MTTATKDLTLTVERQINAAPETVFDAWLAPEMLARFMLPGENMGPPDVTTDPREGGAYSILMKGAETEILHSGTYLEITRATRLVFTWHSPFSIEGSTVALDFAPKGGGTLVTLTHTRFETPELRDQHEGGWTRILMVLGEVMQPA